MDELEYVLSRLRERSKPLKQIAQESGVPKDTLDKIISERTKSPQYLTVRKLREYFKQETCGGSHG